MIKYSYLLDSVVRQKIKKLQKVEIVSYIRQANPPTPATGSHALYYVLYDICP